MEKIASRWRKAKVAIGRNLCVSRPGILDGDDAPSSRPSSSSTAAAVDSSSAPVSASVSEAPSEFQALMPNTPTTTSSGLRRSRSGSRSSKRICAICLAAMKPGRGHALFTAECSHTFHFHCIASNVKHGNHVCPVCRAKWKEVPFRGTPTSGSSDGRSRDNPMNWLQDDGYMNILRQLPHADSSSTQHNSISLFHSSEPSLFNDDETLDYLPEAVEDSQHGCLKALEIKTYPEFSSIPKSVLEEDFTILIHLKAPLSPRKQNLEEDILGNCDAPRTSRASVDLVTVLDVSGSMAGTKLALLKRAMGFVIQNLGPSDRLSIIAFSSTARRLFPLRRMTESGRLEALQAVSSLTSNGGTNIEAGLRKGAKVMEDRKERNPVCSIMLLSDGQDTYILAPTIGVRHQSQPNYSSLVPSSILGAAAQHVPIHVFGFGADHDSASMHSISETSGGTFSFIEAEAAIQDAFAQCIGGLLSVVVQEMQVQLKCMHPGVHLSCIRSGNYSCEVLHDGRSGSIDVGDLYAEEERDFLITVNVPSANEDTLLIEVYCVYKDPLTKDIVRPDGSRVIISRPVCVEAQTVSMEVDRQRNRLQAAEAMAKARQAAERGELSEAVSILEECQKKLSQSQAGRSGDQLSMSLDSELKEMQGRMASRQRYEESGRAYVLSGLSSHSWQRATTRGNSTDSGILIQAYQTPSMVDMLQRSQTFGPAPSHTNQRMRQARSFPARPRPT